MSEYKDFSSLPPDKETHFVVFEKTSVEALNKARIIAVIVSMVFLVSVMIVVYSHPEPENLMADDDMGLLKKADETPAGATATAGAAGGEAAAATGGEAAAPADEAAAATDGEKAGEAGGEAAGGEAAGGDEAAGGE